MTSQFTEILPVLHWLDVAGLAYLLLGAWAIGWRIEHPSAAKPSVTIIMAEHRLAWMQRLAERNVRIFDSQILSSLRESTSFFASSCLLAIGGVLALIGNVEPLTGIAQELHTDAGPAVLWRLKLFVVALFLAIAFLRFVWSNRVFGYCAIMIGAMPNEPDAPDMDIHIRRAADLNARAAMNFNRGLRAMYFALGAAAWMAGPIALLLATTAALWVVWSREFASVPRQILSQ